MVLTDDPSRDRGLLLSLGALSHRSESDGTLPTVDRGHTFGVEVIQQVLEECYFGWEIQVQFWNTGMGSAATGRGCDRAGPAARFGSVRFVLSKLPGLNPLVQLWLSSREVRFVTDLRDVIWNASEREHQLWSGSKQLL